MDELGAIPAGVKRHHHLPTITTLNTVKKVYGWHAFSIPRELRLNLGLCRGILICRVCRRGSRHVQNLTKNSSVSKPNFFFVNVCPISQNQNMTTHLQVFHGIRCSLYLSNNTKNKLFLLWYTPVNTSQGLQNSD